VDKTYDVITLHGVHWFTLMLLYFATQPFSPVVEDRYKAFPLCAVHFRHIFLTISTTIAQGIAHVKGQLEVL